MFVYIYIFKQPKQIVSYFNSMLNEFNTYFSSKSKLILAVQKRKLKIINQQVKTIVDMTKFQWIEYNNEIKNITEIRLAIAHTHTPSSATKPYMF
jgi:hypothetical protein